MAAGNRWWMESSEPQTSCWLGRSVSHNTGSWYLTKVRDACSYNSDISIVSPLCLHQSNWNTAHNLQYLYMHRRCIPLITAVLYA